MEFNQENFHAAELWKFLLHSLGMFVYVCACVFQSSYLYAGRCGAWLKIDLWKQLKVIYWTCKRSRLQHRPSSIQIY